MMRSHLQVSAASRAGSELSRLPHQKIFCLVIYFQLFEPPCSLSRSIIMSVIYPIGATAAIALGVFVPLWAILDNFAKRCDARPAVLPPAAERVLILGASSGVGRTLAHRYAKRGAKVCAVARRGTELEVVQSECKALAASSSESDLVLTISADITRAEDLISVRDIISESESLALALISIPYLISFFTEWRGFDTLIVAAGVSALRPVLDIAGVEGPSVTQPCLDGVRRVEDVAMAAIKGNYVGPLLSVVTMVCLHLLLDLTPPMIAHVTDSFHAEHEHLPFRSLDIVPRCCDPRTDSSNLRVKQGRILPFIPIPFHRTSLREFFICASSHHRGQLSSFGSGWWTDARRSKSKWPEA